MRIKSLSFSTVFSFFILISCAQISRAEYYVVYSAPVAVTDCGACRVRPHMNYHRVYRRAACPRYKRHYVYHRPRNQMKVEVYYGWVVNPAPTCCNVGWVSSRCGSPCESRYNRVDDYVDEGTPYDTATGDDIY